MLNLPKKAWSETASGEKVSLVNPDIDTIKLEDIAHHLGGIQRYNGACHGFYSVAEHSVLLARFVLSRFGPHAAMAALLHDTPEAYLQDITSPIKPAIPGYGGSENMFLLLIYKKLGIPSIIHLKNKARVKLFDKQICLDEREALLPKHRPENRWFLDEDDFFPLGVKIKKWRPRKAKKMFLKMFYKLRSDMRAFEEVCG